MSGLDAFAADLALTDEGGGRFRRAGAEDGRVGFLFAGTITSLLLTAATRAVPDKELRSVDALFLRAARWSEDAEVVVHPLHVGSQLTAVAVAIEQHGRTCAHAQMVLGPRTADLARHAVRRPSVPGPEESGIGYANHPGESRVVGEIDLALADQSLPPVISVWRRAPGLAATGLRPEALLAFDACAYLTGAALLPHKGLGLSGTHSSFTAAITASHMVFHEPVDLDDWVLVHNESTYAGSGWAHGHGQIHDRSGALLISFTLQGMVRARSSEQPGAL